MLEIFSRGVPTYPASMMVLGTANSFTDLSLITLDVLPY